jgi:hypothetical protein
VAVEIVVSEDQGFWILIVYGLAVVVGFYLIEAVRKIISVVQAVL